MLAHSAKARKPVLWEAVIGWRARDHCLRPGFTAQIETSGLEGAVWLPRQESPRPGQTQAHETLPESKVTRG